MKLVVVQSRSGEHGVGQVGVVELVVGEVALGELGTCQVRARPDQIPSETWRARSTNAHAFGNDAGLPTIPPELTLLSVAPVKMAPFRPAS